MGVDVMALPVATAGLGNMADQFSGINASFCWCGAAAFCALGVGAGVVTAAFWGVGAMGVALLAARFRAVKARVLSPSSPFKIRMCACSKARVWSDMASRLMVWVAPPMLSSPPKRT